MRREEERIQEERRRLEKERSKMEKKEEELMQSAMMIKEKSQEIEEAYAVCGGCWGRGDWVVCLTVVLKYVSLGLFKVILPLNQSI